MKNFLKIGILALSAMMAPQSHASSETPTADIVDTAVAAGDFTTLAAALGAANLVDTLKSEGPFTVFAPLDLAFSRLPGGTVEALLEDIPTLSSILTYHVVGGSLSLRELLMSKDVATVQGGLVKVEKRGGRIFVNDALVVAKVKATNGVIYVIDTVLIPEAK
jgi:uncharacterized surface protein with fasciclin (FAS1) repeats